MWLPVVGVLVNLFALFGVISNVTSGDFSSSAANILVGVCAAFWGLSLLGLIVMATGRKKAGGIMVIVGSIAFVPIGLIACIGARKVMKAANSDIDARRRLAPANDSAPPSA